MPDQLTALREWATALLEMEAKATPGKWLMDVTRKKHQQNQSLESAQVVPMEYGRMVASLHITAWKQGHRDARPDARLIAASRNALRPLAEMVLGLLDDAEHVHGEPCCEALIRWTGDGTACAICVGPKCQLATLAAKVLPEGPRTESEAK